MQEQVYLNGQMMPISEASISILDRGFMFGDGVYEVIPVYRGKVFRQQQHLDRLRYSLENVRIHNPLSDDGWRDVFTQLMQANTAEGDASIYLQVTRGVMEKRDHAFSDDLKPTVLVMCRPVSFPPQDLKSTGYRAITLEDNRWADCHIKSINLLPNALLKQQAIDDGAVEAILIRDGMVIEGSASNLFIVKDDIVQTPAKTRHMLGGITRDLVIELCQANKVIVQEKEISEDDLHDADEIWMTSSTREIMPITWLNRHKVGKGLPGPKWQQVIQFYQAYIEQLVS